MSDFTQAEVAAELRMTWMTAADRMSYACNLAGRLPVTFAAMGAGLIDPVHAKIIYEQNEVMPAGVRAGSCRASCSVTSRVPAGPATWNAQGAVSRRAAAWRSSTHFPSSTAIYANANSLYCASHNYTG